MKVYLGVKYHADNRNKDFIEDVTASLLEVGIETVCIVRDIEKWGQVSLSSGELMKVTFKLMDSCGIVVIDLSEKGVGLGIEAGYAFAKCIPLFTIAKSGSDISKTLMGISKKCFSYENIKGIRGFLLENIKMIQS